MLNQINMDIVDMVLDLMHVHNFPCHMVYGVKMLLFLELMIVLPCMLIINDATISAEAKCSINVFKSEKKMWVCITMKVAVFYANGVKMYQFKAKD